MTEYPWLFLHVCHFNEFDVVFVDFLEVIEAGLVWLCYMKNATLVAINEVSSSVAVQELSSHKTIAESLFAVFISLIGAFERHYRQFCHAYYTISAEKSAKSLGHYGVVLLGEVGVEIKNLFNIRLGLEER
jgi:hypothetical protein